MEKAETGKDQHGEDGPRKQRCAEPRGTTIREEGGQGEAAQADCSLEDKCAWPGSWNSQQWSLVPWALDGTGAGGRVAPLGEGPRAPKDAGGLA